MDLSEHLAKTNRADGRSIFKHLLYINKKIKFAFHSEFIESILLDWNKRKSHLSIFVCEEKKNRQRRKCFFIFARCDAII